MNFSLKYPKPPEDARIIRTTSSLMYKSCRRLWHYASPPGLGMNLIPKEIKASDARSFGTAVHAGIAAYYLSKAEGDSWEEGCVKAQAAWEEAREGLDSAAYLMGDFLIGRYLSKVNELDGDAQVCFIDGKPAVEVTMYAPIELSTGETVWLQGTADLLLWRKDSVHIIDHKTYRQYLQPYQVAFDEQLSRYIWLLNQNGIPCRTAHYNQFLKKIPPEPRLLQNGSLSKSGTAGYDRQQYLEAMDKLGLSNDKDLLQFADTLQTFESFRREQVLRTRFYMKTLEERMRLEFEDIFNNPHIYPNSGQHCNWCDFKTLCQTKNEGGDTDLVIQMSFQEDERNFRRTS